jgi:hypothetical protein
MPATPGSNPGDHGISVHSTQERGEKAPWLKKNPHKRPKVINFFFLFAFFRPR